MQLFRKRRPRHQLSSFCEPLESRCLLSATYAVIDLGAFSSGNGTSVATAINAQGEVVGYSSAAGNINHPFLYADGILHDLNPDGSDSTAWGINDAGQIVGKNGSGFLYSNGTME